MHPNWCIGVGLPGHTRARSSSYKCACVVLNVSHALTTIPYFHWPPVSRRSGLSSHLLTRANLGLAMPPPRPRLPFWTPAPPPFLFGTGRRVPAPRKPPRLPLAPPAPPRLFTLSVFVVLMMSSRLISILSTILLDFANFLRCCSEKQNGV